MNPAGAYQISYSATQERRKGVSLRHGRCAPVTGRLAFSVGFPPDTVATSTPEKNVTEAPGQEKEAPLALGQEQTLAVVTSLLALATPVHLGDLQAFAISHRLFLLPFPHERTWALERNRAP